MKRFLILAFAALCLAIVNRDTHGQDSKSRFPKVNGAAVRAVYLEPWGGDDFIIGKFNPIADTGIEVERYNKSRDLVWRTNISGVANNHSAYRQNAYLIEKDGELIVLVKGGHTISAVLKIETGEIITIRKDGKIVEAEQD